MITNTEVFPVPALAPYIRCYTYRELDTFGTVVNLPWHASYEINIPLFFKAVPVTLKDSTTGKILKTGSNCDVVGLSSQYNGEMTFAGFYSFFQINFKPNGFYKIFGIPPIQITDKIVCGEHIFGKEIKLLIEQLSETCSIKKMAALADGWLLHYLSKRQQAYYHDRITTTANLIITKSGIIGVDSLAMHANMSTRNFERRFINEVGMSPKQLCNIARFNHALALKQKKPQLKWTSIAHQSGYFDQMHLIKDFKRFCGNTPLTLIRQTPLLKVRYINSIDG